MIYERDIEILRLLHKGTTEGKIQWRRDPDDWYCATLAGREIAFRYLYYEATNQIGADPHTFELSLPGRNAKFACGTEGFAILTEILEAAFVKDDGVSDNYAVEFLRDALERPN